MSYVFISYSKKNRDYASQLAEFLKNAGFDVWMDDELEPSEDWWRMIVRAIRDCGAFLVIMSPESEESKWVQREIYQAEDAKPIFPLLLNGDPDLRKSEIWSLFGRIQYEDVRAANMPSEKFLSKLSKKVPRKDQGQDRNNADAAASDMIRQIIGEPFEWVHIPAGNVEIEGHGVFEVDAFALAKYPVTVAQYTTFISDGGYQQAQYWTPAGWAWRQAQNRTQPRYWDDAEHQEFSEPIHPVIGVSWYEASAFCHWLGERSDQQIVLPAEQQWQHAAQGDDQRKYPWGNAFRKNRCNNYESNIKHPTPVIEYPQGMSPYGVMDMSGNVWEWMRSDFDNPAAENIENSSTQSLRGGSFRDSIEYVQCTYRNGLAPELDSLNWGFRCARIY